MIKRLSVLALPVLFLLVSSCQLVRQIANGHDEGLGAPDSVQAVLSDAESVAADPPASEQADSHEVEGAPPVEVLVAGGGQTLETPAPETVQEEQSAAKASTDIWQRIRDGFQLDPAIRDRRIEREIAWYSKHQDYLDRVSARAQRYLYYILQEVKRRQLPAELALLPIVESAYDPFAYSQSRAMGIWQFIPATGALYGLKRDWWYDGRRDIRAATGAALDFLEDLCREFDNDWPLALAAYNSGAGNVRAAIARNKRLGRPTDFWSLKLLAETSSYVPRLYAIARLVADPDAYGVRFLSIADQPYWAEADIGTQIDLTLAAQLADITVSELYLLNPGFNRWATHPDGPYTLLVPAGHAETFRHNLAALDLDDRVGWRRVRVREGENLGIIAQRYGTTVATLKRVNHLRGDMIRAGKSLMIPTALRSKEQYTLSDEQRRDAAGRYYAREHGGDPVIHPVVFGDNLWDVARKYGVDYRALARWNGMATTDLLQVGQELKVWPAKPLLATSAPPSAGAVGPEVIRKLDYRVRRGESLSRIASKFNLTVDDIRQWNRHLDGHRYLQPGDKLVLYVDVMEGE